jgi:hypothetical protein
VAEAMDDLVSTVVKLVADLEGMIPAGFVLPGIFETVEGVFLKVGAWTGHSVGVLGHRNLLARCHVLERDEPLEKRESKSRCKEGMAM